MTICKRALALGIGLSTAVAGCGGGNDGDRYDLNGLVQKGPFIQGTSITVQEMSATFAPTGNIFNTQTTDDFGAFSLTSDLSSPFVEIISDGFYFDEVAGSLSTAQLTLRVIAGAADGATINTNLLTTLESERIKYLIAEEDRTFADAQAQAKNEILAVFGIPTADAELVSSFAEMDISKEGDENAILLAVSALLQEQRSVAELSELISKLGQDLREDGDIDDAAFIETLKNSAATLDLDQVRVNLSSRYSDLGLDITVPAFEDFIDSDGDNVINKLDYVLEGPLGLASNSKPTLTWSPSRLEGVTYQVQIATDEAFSNIIERASELIETSYAVTTTLEDNAVYYWRVLVTGSGQDVIDWAGAQEFRVVLGSVPGLDTPGVYDEVNGEYVTNNVQPTFTWEVNENAATYDFILSTSEDLSDPLIDETGLVEPEFTVKTALPSTEFSKYYWAIIPVDGNQVAGEQSDTAAFVLDTVAPVGTVEIANGDDVTASERVLLGLTATDAQRVAQVEISTVSDFNGVQRAAFADSTVLEFPPNQEIGTVLTAYVRFIDVAGNVSEVITDDITLRRTLVSDIISADETWTLADSPIVLQGVVGVAPDVTVTIQAGVRVEVPGDATLLIKGFINATGTAEAPIVVTGHAGEFNATAFLIEDTNLSNFTMNELHFEGLERAIYIGNETEHEQSNVKVSGTLTITDSTFTETEVRTGGYETDAVLILDSPVISKSHIIGEYPRSEAIEIRAATITDSVIESDSYNDGIVIADSVMTGGEMIIGCCEGNIVIDGSTITDVQFREGGGSPVNGPIAFIDSTLVDVAIDLPYARIDMSQTDVSYTAERPSRHRLRIGNGTLDHVRVAGNTAGAGVEVTGDWGYSSSADFQVSNSIFTGNRIGILATGGSRVFSITGSNLDGNSELALKNDRQLGITATGNYWGSSDNAAIDAAIYDVRDDIQSGTVTYDPIANEPVAGAGPQQQN